MKRWWFTVVILQWHFHAHAFLEIYQLFPEESSLESSVYVVVIRPTRGPGSLTYEPKLEEVERRFIDFFLRSRMHEYQQRGIALPGTELWNDLETLEGDDRMSSYLMVLEPSKSDRRKLRPAGLIRFSRAYDSAGELPMVRRLAKSELDYGQILALGFPPIEGDIPSDEYAFWNYPEINHQGPQNFLDYRRGDDYLYAGERVEPRDNIYGSRFAPVGQVEIKSFIQFANAHHYVVPLLYFMSEYTQISFRMSYVMINGSYRLDHPEDAALLVPSDYYIETKTPGLFQRFYGFRDLNIAHPSLLQEGIHIMHMSRAEYLGLGHRLELRDRDGLLKRDRSQVYNSGIDLIDSLAFDQAVRLSWVLEESTFDSCQQLFH